MNEDKSFYSLPEELKLTTKVYKQYGTNTDRIIEQWEKNDDGVWKDVTKRVLNEYAIEDAKNELRKSKLLMEKIKNKSENKNEG